ncbi:hypothetical protein KIPB_009388, partial [Kipferlia bialata]
CRVNSASFTLWYAIIFGLGVLESVAMLAVIMRMQSVRYMASNHTLTLVAMLTLLSVVFLGTVFLTEQPEEPDAQTIVLGVGVAVVFFGVSSFMLTAGAIKKMMKGGQLTSAEEDMVEGNLTLKCPYCVKKLTVECDCQRWGARRAQDKTRSRQAHMHNPLYRKG